MRIFIASLATETNTFAPFPTGMAGFEEYGVVRDASLRDGPLSGPMKVFRRRAEKDGHEVIESLSAFAQPAGRTVRSVYEKLRDEILADLAAAPAVDVILLMLHGAMVAEGYDDCEGDILTRARALREDAVIGVELDLHCHLTRRMVEQADLVITVKEYPHIDFADRAHELYAGCVRIARGEIRPAAALIDTHLVGFYPTFDPPMRGIVDALKAVEGEPGVISASIGHGFPWADVADVGTRVLVYADGDPALAAGHARAIARRLYEERHALAPDYPDVAPSLERQRGLNGKVVIGDFADNAGGGAPGDSTFILRAMIERGVTDAAIGAFWDPIVAQVARDAGVGARLEVRLGGKSGRASGEPLDLEVEVMGIAPDHDQGVFGQRQPLGLSAWLRAGGIDILVASVRTQIFEPDAFTGIGMTLEDKKLVVVKSSNHFQAGFTAGADHLWRASSPGALSLDIPRLPYTKRDPVFFPKVDDPWATLGEPQPSVKTARGAASLTP